MLANRLARTYVQFGFEERRTPAGLLGGAYRPTAPGAHVIPPQFGGPASPAGLAAKQAETWPSDGDQYYWELKAYNPEMNTLVARCLAVNGPAHVDRTMLRAAALAFVMFDGVASRTRVQFGGTPHVRIRLVRTNRDAGVALLGADIIDTLVSTALGAPTPTFNLAGRPFGDAGSVTGAALPYYAGGLPSMKHSRYNKVSTGYQNHVSDSFNFTLATSQEVVSLYENTRGWVQGRTRERNPQLQRLLSRPFSTRFG